MALDLPRPIQAYFDGSPRFDVDAMVAPFAPDAVVRDENNEHRGAAAIRAWIEEASVGNKAINTPRAIESEGDRHRVTTEVEGDFKGSPVTLTFNFVLKNDRIDELEIVQCR